MIDHLWVLMPVHDDWEASEIVLGMLGRSLSGDVRRVSVVLADDRSHEPPPADYPRGSLGCINRVERVRIVRNVGHQRAIALGLCHLHRKGIRDPIVIMDADGEDAPADVPRLLETFRAHAGRQVVFAERRRRSEGLVFRLGYWCYRTLHRLLTGHGVRVGNFSVLGPDHVPTLTASKALWSHYAAAVFTSGIRYTAVPTERATRVAGRSKMNVVSLATHGLRAISVFSDVVGVRLFLVTLLVALLASMGMMTVVAVRLSSGLAIPGWATSAGGILLIILGQSVMAAIGMSLLTLYGDGELGRYPIRYHDLLIEGVETIRP